MYILNQFEISVGGRWERTKRIVLETKIRLKSPDTISISNVYV